MDESLSFVCESEKPKPAQKVKIWRERQITDDVIFYGTDESGRSGWFLRLTLIGLYPRRVGPYKTKYQATEVLEKFIAHMEVEPLCELMNSMTIHQDYVVEGVPLLVGTQHAPVIP